MDCSSPSSSVHEILQARILEWVPCPPPGDLPNPGIEPGSLGLMHWRAGSLPPMPPGKPKSPSGCSKMELQLRTSDSEGGQRNMASKD